MITKSSVATISSSSVKPAWLRFEELRGRDIFDLTLFLNGRIDIDRLVENALRFLPHADNEPFCRRPAIHRCNDGPANIVCGAARVVRIHIRAVVARNLAGRKIDGSSVRNQRAASYGSVGG